jgi:hypothetical protein
MADQGHWFKLWCSADDDPDLGNLEVADFGRWCKLGMYTKAHGTAGTLSFRPPAWALCRKLQLPDFQAVVETIQRFPHVHITCTNCGENGSVTSETNAIVTFQNWQRYQGDMSRARTRRWRARVTAKKRGEEKRTPKPPVTQSSQGPNPRQPTAPAGAKSNPPEPADYRGISETEALENLGRLADLKRALVTGHHLRDA